MSGAALRDRGGRCRRGLSRERRGFCGSAALVDACLEPPEAAAAGGAMLLSTIVPPNLAAAMARTPARGTLKDIEHVVLLMQENRSFDHYFGTLPGCAASTTRTRIDAARPAGRSSTSPTRQNPDGYLLPFHLDTQHHQRADHPVHQPRLGGPARGVERRHDGQLAAGPPHGRRRATAPTYGLLRRAPDIPFHSRWPRLHHLRRLPLLGAWARPGPTGSTG